MSYYYSKYGAISLEKANGKKVILTFLLLLILVAAGTGYFLYTIIFSPNVWVKKGETSIYIPTDATYEMVLDSLYNKGIIVHRKNFEWLAQHKSYPELVKPGHYIIRDGLNNNELINQLRAGLQNPVNVTFNNVRNIEQLAGRISKQLETDSVSLVQLLNDSAYIGQLGFTKQSLPALFIPNTYEFYWNTDANDFVSRMFQEYRKFWNESRVAKAEKKLI